MSHILNPEWSTHLHAGRTEGQVPAPPTPSLLLQCAVIPARDLLAFEGCNVHNEKLKEKGCSKRIMYKETGKTAISCPGWMSA